MQDRLQVLTTTQMVVQRSLDVQICRATLKGQCQKWLQNRFAIPEWNGTIHWSDGTLNTANYILLLDSLNFCFWSEPGEPRWGISYQGQFYDGYNALAAALKAAVESGRPLLQAEYLAQIQPEDLEAILHPPGQTQGRIPLWELRLANIREVGQVLHHRYEGQFANLIAGCQGSAVRLADRISQEFVSFCDEATYQGHRIRLLKRAQITVVDVWGALRDQAARSLVAFQDLDQLTAFADYKIPQVLRTLGILRYSEPLAQLVDNRREIPAGSSQEVEIRAAMIWAVEWIRQALAEGGWNVAAHELDWVLWNIGQEKLPDERPYHRTRTVFY